MKGVIDMDKPKNFLEDLKELINRHCKENDRNEVYKELEQKYNSLVEQVEEAKKEIEKKANSYLRVPTQTRLIFEDELYKILNKIKLTKSK